VCCVKCVVEVRIQCRRLTLRVKIVISCFPVASRASMISCPTSINTSADNLVELWIRQNALPAPPAIAILTIFDEISWKTRKSLLEYLLYEDESIGIHFNMPLRSVLYTKLAPSFRPNISECPLLVFDRISQSTRFITRVSTRKIGNTGKRYA
jgi:hypothetical protein